MALQTVRDLYTLNIFLEEMGVLWKDAQDRLFSATDPNARDFYRKECAMYSNLLGKIVYEVYLLIE